MTIFSTGGLRVLKYADFRKLGVPFCDICSWGTKDKLKLPKNKTTAGVLMISVGACIPDNILP